MVLAMEMVLVGVLVMARATAMVMALAMVLVLLWLLGRVVLMLIVAGLLEGFARQLIDATVPRLMVGGFMLVWWLGYFFVFGRWGARH